MKWRFQSVWLARMSCWYAVLATLPCLLLYMYASLSAKLLTTRYTCMVSMLQITAGGVALLSRFRLRKSPKNV
jgi:hypothetical protein